MFKETMRSNDGQGDYWHVVVIIYLGGESWTLDGNLELCPMWARHMVRRGSRSTVEKVSLDAKVEAAGCTAGVEIFIVAGTLYMMWTAKRLFPRSRLIDNFIAFRCSICFSHFNVQGESKQNVQVQIPLFVTSIRRWSSLVVDNHLLLHLLTP